MADGVTHRRRSARTAASARRISLDATGRSAPDAAIELSIVMPCLNEAETLATCIRKAKRSIAELGVAGEVIVADNGSTDGSQAIARRNGARVVDVAERGYGHALMGGIAAARGRFVIMGDADDSYDFARVGPFLEKLREGHDVVLGNRFAGGVRPGAMPWLNRYVGNPILTALGRLFFRSPVRDFHCGLRGIRRDAVQTLDLRTAGMEFASEMVVKASLKGLRVTEVPTTLGPAGRTRRPHLRPWRDGWRHLRFLLLYSPRWLFFYPGLALMALGAAVQLWLLPRPRQIGNATFDVGTLLIAGVAIIVGFQSVLFAVFSKVFAVTEGLLPEDPRLTKLFRHITLEVGVLAGIAFLVAGLGGMVFAFVSNSFEEFGEHLSSSLRVVIPSLISIILGCQIVLSSFFLSVLGLSRRGVEPAGR